MLQSQIIVSGNSHATLQDHRSHSTQNLITGEINNNPPQKQSVSGSFWKTLQCVAVSQSIIAWKSYFIHASLAVKHGRKSNECNEGYYKVVILRAFITDKHARMHY